MIRKLLKSKWSMVIMIVTWLLLIWARTFTGMASGTDATSVWSILCPSVIAIACTFIYGANYLLWNDEIEFIYEDDEAALLEEFYDEEEDEEAEEQFLYEPEDRIRDKSNVQSPALGRSLLVVMILAAFCLFSFASAEWNGWIDLFSDRIYMELGIFAFNKKYFFDVLMIIVFPLWTTFIIRKIAESRCSAEAVMSGVFQILTLTLMGFLLYMRLPNIWLLEMAFINCLTLIMAVKEYLWKDIDKKGNALALLIGYVLFWVLLMSMFTYSGQTVAGFMGVENLSDASIPSSYVSNVRTIMKEAAFVGQSPSLVENIYVAEFMMERTNPIIGALFYGGWSAAILLVLVSIIFVVTAGAILICNKHRDGRDVMLCMAWAALVVRLVAGTLYSFGIPITIVPLFTGDVGIRMDSMCMTLLILSCLHNKATAWFEEMEEAICEELEEEEFDEEDE
jgi:hypothetical protein